MIRRPSRLVLLGHPVAHSLSPVFQNAALRSAALPSTYEALDVAPDALEPVVRALAAEGAAGNVTVPHKERIFALCASHTPVAARVGAVNTFWFDDGALAGDNTDVAGFDAMARMLVNTARPQRVAILGAGGAAAAVLVAIAGWADAEVTIYNRTTRRAAELAERILPRARIAASSADAVAGASCVINATTAGMANDAHPVALDDVPSDAAIIDLVVRRGGTAWVRDARARGHAATDGLPMLLEQGALAFERWFGIPAPRAAMRAAVAP